LSHLQATEHGGVGGGAYTMPTVVDTEDTLCK